MEAWMFRRYLGGALVLLLSYVYRRRKFRDLWNGPNGPPTLFPQQSRDVPREPREKTREEVSTRPRQEWKRRTGKERGKLLPVHSAIASDSRGFLRESRVRRLPLAAVESSVVSPRFPSLPPLVVVVQVSGGDAEETAGVPVKGKAERPDLRRRTWDGWRGEIGPDPWSPTCWIIARIAAKVTSRWTANVGVYHSERR